MVSVYHRRFHLEGISSGVFVPVEKKHAVFGRRSALCGVWTEECFMRCLDGGVLYAVFGQRSASCGVWTEECFGVISNVLWEFL